MGKSVSVDVLDAALDALRAAGKMVALPSQPTTYAEANAAKLAEATLAPADMVKGPGDVSGRKLTIAAKSGVPVAAAGTATHVALLDGATSRLLYVTTCPAQALPSGGQVSFAAWDIEFGNPV